MSREQKEKAIRISVDLSPRCYERLEQIEEKVSASSKAEVVREALRLYEFLVGHACRGTEFQLLEKGSTTPKTIVMFTEIETEEQASA